MCIQKYKKCIQQKREEYSTEKKRVINRTEKSIQQNKKEYSREKKRVINKTEEYSTEQIKEHSYFFYFKRLPSLLYVSGNLILLIFPYINYQPISVYLKPAQF